MHDIATLYVVVVSSCLILLFIVYLLLMDSLSALCRWMCLHMGSSCVRLSQGYRPILTSCHALRYKWQRFSSQSLNNPTAPYHHLLISCMSHFIKPLLYNCLTCVGKMFIMEALIIACKSSSRTHPVLILLPEVNQDFKSTYSTWRHMLCKQTLSNSYTMSDNLEKYLKVINISFLILTADFHLWQRGRWLPYFDRRWHVPKMLLHKCLKISDKICLMPRDLSIKQGLNAVTLSPTLRWQNNSPSPI